MDNLEPWIMQEREVDDVDEPRVNWSLQNNG